MRLVLVRHGLPVIDESAPSATWALSEEGRSAARRLAPRLAAHDPTALVASTEPKAQDTALEIGAVLGLPVQTDPGLAEHHRRSTPFGTREQFEASVARFFAEPAVLSLGEETADAAHARFDAALRGRLSGEGCLVAVAHGAVISLWVSRALGLDPFPLWKDLGMAEAIVMTNGGFEVVRPG